MTVEEQQSVALDPVATAPRSDIMSASAAFDRDRSVDVVQVNVRATFV